MQNNGFLPQPPALSAFPKPRNLGAIRPSRWFSRLLWSQHALLPLAAGGEVTHLSPRWGTQSSTATHPGVRNTPSAVADIPL